MKQIFILLASLLIFSCNQDKNNNLETENGLQKVWTSTTNLTTYASSFEPIIHKDLVLYCWNMYNTTNQPTTPIIAYNKNSGDKIWEWNDFIEDIEFFSSWNNYHLDNDNLVLASSKGNIYIIDLSSGETIEKITVEGGRPSVRGKDNFISYISGSSVLNWVAVNVTNINNFDTKEILVINEEEEDKEPRIEPPLIYYNENGDLIALLSYHFYNYNPLLISNQTIMFYNLSTDSIIHEANYDLYGLRIVEDNGKIYGIDGEGENLVCINGNSFEEEWKVYNPNSIGQSGILIVNDFLFHGSEGDAASFYCRNKNTGELIWKTSGASTSSFLSYYNDVLYANGGSDGNLHAIDITTGKKILLMESPDYQNDNGAFFDIALSIDPETGRIYTANYISALCYEPYGQ